MTRRSPAGLAACRRAIAATEFALVVPLMVFVLFGTVEFGNALLLDRKVIRSVHTGADILSQSTGLSSADLNDVVAAMREILRPFDATRAQIIVSSVWRDPNTNSVRVDWSFAANATAYGAGSGYTLPRELVPEAGESVIVAELRYPYEPLFGTDITGPITLGHEAYLRPRRTDRVRRT